MKTRILILSAFLTSILTALGQTKSYFPTLTKVSIDTSYKAYFGYDKSSRLINKFCGTLDKKDPFYCSESSLIEGVVVARYKNQALKDSVNILFSGGMSDDPEFSVYTKSGRTMGRIACVEFYINSSGTIYTSGHANNMYNRRRKFQIQNDTILEIKQPYNYVGMKGKTQKDITLYKDMQGSDIVAQLPKGYEIEILLTDATTKDYQIDHFFLVKTDFGLIGWLRLTNEDIYGAVLKDLFYAGD
jgi:hypothetical protein